MRLFYTFIETHTKVHTFLVRDEMPLCSELYDDKYDLPVIPLPK